MVAYRLATCELLGGHCRHWGLSDVDHAVTHAFARMTEAIYEQDMAAGHAPGQGSESSIRDDGQRLRALLADEGYVLVPS